jgi:hypothetical protein
MACATAARVAYVPLRGLSIMNSCVAVVADRRGGDARGAEVRRVGLASSRSTSASSPITNAGGQSLELLVGRAQRRGNGSERRSRSGS